MPYQHLKYVQIITKLTLNESIIEYSFTLAIRYFFLSIMKAANYFNSRVKFLPITINKYTCLQYQI